MIRTAALALLLPSAAQALSCVPQSVPLAYDIAARDEVEHVMVHGTLGDLPPPLTYDETDEKSRATTVTLTGTAAGVSGFVIPFDDDITLEETCLGPWCPRLEDGQDMLMFLERENGALTLRLDACYASVVFDPTDAQLETAATCLRDRRCPK